MTATLLPPAEITFNDSNGKPLAGGSVFYYIPNTSTKKNTWQDAAQTILNTNPIVLDASGRAIVWGSGTYRQVVYDQFGNLVWDQITEDSSAGLIGNMTDNVWVAGASYTDPSGGVPGTFVPGVTVALNLTTGPGSLANTWIYFDPLYQDDSQVLSLVGTTLTFNDPIPVGTGTVTVKIGNTVAIGTPGNGTITDAMIAAGAGINSSKLSYTEGAPGSLARTVQSRLQDIISIKDFGAVGDGVADDTNAANAFFAALQNGGFGFLPDGTYNVTSGQVINKPITILGGQNAILHNTNAGLTVPMLHVEAAATQGTTLEGFSITSVALIGGAPAVAAVQVDAGQQYVIRGLNIRGTQRGIFISAASAGAVIEDCYVSATSDDGYLVFDGNLTFANCYAIDCAGVGFHFMTTVVSAGITMANCTGFNNAGGNFSFIGTSSAAIQDVFLSNLVASSCPNNPNYLFDTWGKNIQLNGCFSELAGCNIAGAPVSASPGFHFTPNNHRLTLTGCQSTASGGHGIVMECPYFSINGGDYTSNGVFAFNTCAGISVGPSGPVNNFAITGINTVPKPIADNNSQGWGIAFGASGNSVGTIVGNALSGTVAPISIPTPSSLTVSANAGFVNEASGVAVITAGNQTVSVTHGMNVAPSVVLLTIVDGSGPTSLVVLANTPNESGFTIFMSATTGSDVAVSWYARQ